MITREKIYESILADQNVTDAVVAVSASYVEDHVEKSIPAYFRVCAALSEVVTELDLMNHGPEGLEGTMAQLAPYVVLGMPGVSDGVIAAWSEAYLKPTTEDGYLESLRSAVAEGDAGKPNYVHGLMIMDTVADIIKGVAGTSLMVAAAVKMEENLDEGFSSDFGMPKVH